MFQSNSDRLITEMLRARPSEMAGTWIVAQTLSSREQRVADVLCAESIQNYLPLLSGYKKNGGGNRRRVMRPLYRGYVFVCCRDYEDEYRTRRNSDVFGVLAVKDGKGLVESLERIHSKIADGTLSDDFESDLIGRVCYVKGGPWRNREVIPSALNKRGLVCAVTTLGRKLDVEIPVEMLDPVS